MDAYFAENRTISDAEVLADLAADVGVDGGGFIRYLVENERVYAAAVIDEHNAAIEQGVTAVPTIVLDDVLPVQGAQDLESYERWIERLLERRSG
jgi:predicted DsbA family dithiol-disulfide isomerase